MKSRCGFVTNSSSSSFIISNYTDNKMTSKELAIHLIKTLYDDVIRDSNDVFDLESGESIKIECTDHVSENAFEAFIHSIWYKMDDFNGVEIELLESHH